MGKLYIEATYVGLGFHHQYLVYVENEGDPYEKWEAIRAGPLNDNPLDFGPMVAQIGLLKNTRDFYDGDPDAGPPNIPMTDEEYAVQIRGRVLVSDNLSKGDWAKMMSEASEISGNFGYRPLPISEGGIPLPNDLTTSRPALNSNSFINTVLERAGISDYPKPTVQISAPGQNMVLGRDSGEFRNDIISLQGEDINASGGGGNDFLSGNESTEGLRDVNYLNGDSGSDMLVGGTGADFLLGGSGNDVLTGDFYVDGKAVAEGKVNKDQLHGGVGFDEYHIAVANAGTFAENVSFKELYTRNSDGTETTDIIIDNPDAYKDVTVINERNSNNNLAGDGKGKIVIHDAGHEIILSGFTLYIETFPNDDTLYVEYKGDTHQHVEGTFYHYQSVVNGFEVFHTVRFEFEYKDGDLVIVKNDDFLKIENTSPSVSGRTTTAVAVIENFVSGDFGIILEDYDNQPYITGNEGFGLYEDANSSSSPTVINGTNSANTINGNNSDNVIDGKDGDDTLNGGEGDDYITGGAGADIISGGGGDDRIVIDASDISWSGDAGIDTLVFSGAGSLQYSLAQGAFENAEGGDGNDTFWGTSSENYLVGNNGDDTLFGYGGNDTLIGGLGADSLQGGDGDDIVIVDHEDSWWSGDAGIDTVKYSGLENFEYALAQGAFEHAEGGLLDDKLWGTSANNTLKGNDGDDTLFGYGGNDHLIGGAGADSLQGGDGDDVIEADEFDTWWSGDAGIDTFKFVGNGGIQYALAQGAFENAVGNEGNDTFYGESSANNLNGAGGDDVLFGYEGDDTLIGGSGNDFLVGGTGNDSFHFNGVSGQDRISDFSAGLGSDDVLVLSETFTNFTDAMAAASQVGDDTIINFDTDNYVILNGVQLSSLHQDDFQFV